MDWDQILTAVILSVVLSLIGSSGVFIWWIRNRFARNLVEYEADLKKTHDKEVESLKADLQRAAYERQTQYHVLQTKRAKVIAHIYTLLATASRALSGFVSKIDTPGGPSKQQKAQTAADALNKLWEHFDDNRIYFPPNTCQRMRNLINKHADAYDKFALTLPAEDGATSGGSWAAMHKGWKEAYKQVETEIPPLREQIDNQFRGLLGVEEPEEEQEGQG